MRISVLIFIGIISLSSCSKKQNQVAISVEKDSPAPYDTTAIDSFSKGAVSSEIARKIKMSSKSYRDSLLVIKQKAEEERKKQEELSKIEQAAKEALAKEKAVKAKEEVKSHSVESTPPVSTPTPPSTTN